MSLSGLFTDIADAIREKDGTTEGIVANDFPARISAIPSGGGKEYDPLDPADVYKATRPSDWLPMPIPQDNEIYLLFHIPNGISSPLAFTATCTDSYTVALGTVTDGVFVQESAASVSSGSKYETELFADDYGNLTSEGFKQVMIKISGTDITTWEPSAHSKRDRPLNYSAWNIKEISCRLPVGTKVSAGNTTDVRSLQKMEYFSWYGDNAATTMNTMFRYCYSLTAVLQLDTSKVTNMGSMFESCYNIKTIPQLDTSKVTNMSNMFSSCYTMNTIPQLDTSKVTDMSNMFRYCYNIKTIPQLDTSKVTNMSTMFFGVRNIEALPQMDTSKVTNMSSMFAYCSTLAMIPQLNTQKITALYNTFDYTYGLAAITLDPSVTGWAGYAISLSNCSLNHQAIVDLFNSLPTITSSKSLTLTGNPGVSELTEEEKAIATGKNWTLTL